jgi:phage replication O-like protein O
MDEWTGNPQCEDGYVRIANELFEVLMAMPMTVREFKVMLGIMRMTYGWNRKTARLVQKNLAIMTGIDPTNLSKTIKALRAKAMIFVDENRMVTVNKRYREWVVGDMKLSIETTFIGALRKRGLWNGKKSGLVPADWVRLARWAGEVGLEPFVDKVESKMAKVRINSLGFFFADTHGSCVFERVYFREMEAAWEREKRSEADSLPRRQHEENSGSLASSRDILRGLFGQEFGETQEPLSQE